VLGGAIRARALGPCREPIEDRPLTVGQIREVNRGKTHPFVRRYLLQQSPFVGIRSGIEFDENRHARFLDFFDYGDGGLTDEEYRDAFNGRNPETIVATKTA
jgi:hypothetical protein